MELKVFVTWSESVDGDFEIHTKEEWFVADVVIPLV